MIFSFNTPIWLYPCPTDFRKQLDGLIILVADHLQLNPTSGQLFVFRNRQANKLNKCIAMLAKKLGHPCPLTFSRMSAIRYLSPDLSCLRKLMWYFVHYIYFFRSDSTPRNDYSVIRGYRGLPALASLSVAGSECYGGTGTAFGYAISD